MSNWFYLNAILLSMVLFQIVTHFSFPTLSHPTLFGLIGFIFFLFNWTRNAVFSTIRNHPNRQMKIKLANLSKIIMPYHRWTGTLALVFIILHVFFIINWYGFSWQNMKMIFGLIALINLLCLVATGWWRLIKPTKSLRKVHLGLGLSLFIFVTLHVLF